MQRLFKLCILTGILLVSSSLSATELKLNQVTVYLQGAEIQANADVELAKGETELLFSPIASDINDATLQVTAGDGVIIQSFSVRKNYLNSEQHSSAVVNLTEQINQQNDLRVQFVNQLEVINAQSKLIESNLTLADDGSDAKIEAINRMYDFLQDKMSTLLKQRSDINQKIKMIDAQLNKLEKQLQEEHQRDGAVTNQIVVKVVADKHTKTTFNFSYVINDASWQPAYDLHVKKINAPVDLVYKANIRQNSGVDWEQVKLILSTGNPNEGAQAPNLFPQYLNIYQNPIVQADFSKQSAPIASEISMLKSHRINVNDKGLNTSFIVDKPYSIASDNKAHQVHIRQTEVNGEYRYLAIPKLDNDVFLQVDITDWGKLNLLSAKTNIFFEGNYVGQGYIDTKNTQRTLTLSVGRDKKIVVERDEDNNFKTQPAFLGNTLSQQYAYSIKVKNYRHESVKLSVIDQIPVSQDSSISVTDIKADGAQLDKHSGQLEWHVTLDADQTLILPFSYSVKYPKDKLIINL